MDQTPEQMLFDIAKGQDVLMHNTSSELGVKTSLYLVFSVFSKTDVALVNEALCKILCHNIVVLIHEMFELGINPIFINRSEGPNAIGA